MPFIKAMGAGSICFYMSRRLFTIRTAPQNTKLSCEGIKIVTAIPRVRHPKATLGRELPFCADFNDIDLSELVTGDCAWSISEVRVGEPLTVFHLHEVVVPAPAGFILPRNTIPR